MKDENKLYVSDIRQLLIDKYNYTEDQANAIKGKSALLNELHKHDNTVVDLVSELDELDDKIKVTIQQDAAQPIDDSLVPISVQIDEVLNDEPVEVVPSQTDSGWNDYVMTKFTKDELIDGNPTVYGLRRIVELLIGRIIASRSIVAKPPTTNDPSCTITHELTILRHEDGVTLSINGVADTNPENTDYPYSKFLASFADTRAETKALRRALGIKAVGHEEIAKRGFDSNVLDNTENKSINPTQINAIHTLSTKLNINTTKLINSIESLQGRVIAQFSYDEALLLLQELNKYQQNIDSIPQEIRNN